MAQLVLTGCTVNQCILYSAVMCLLGKNINNNGLYAGNRRVNAGIGQLRESAAPRLLTHRTTDKLYESNICD